MELHTYKDWKLLAKQVMQGSKHVARNEKGECLFSEDQLSEDYDPQDYEEPLLSFEETQEMGFWG